jgi:hypothetical protein
MKMATLVLSFNIFKLIFMLKTPIKKGKVFQVDFSLPKQEVEGATEVLVLGDFNEWNVEKATKMDAKADGSFQTSIELTPGTYQFRYLIDGKQWKNAPNADFYEVSPAFLVENSVVKVEKKDDLKEVEGIGPKIETILLEAGIETFAQLAATSVEQLTEILAANVKRPQMYKPNFWIEQAKLKAIH